VESFWIVWEDTKPTENETYEKRFVLSAHAPVYRNTLRLFQNNIKQESSIPTKFLPIIARSIKSEHSDERWQNTIPSKILAIPNLSFLFKRNAILCLKTQIRVLPAKTPAVVPASQKNRPEQKDSFPSEQSFTLLPTYFPIIVSWRGLQVPRNNWAPALIFKRFAKLEPATKMQHGYIS